MTEADPECCPAMRSGPGGRDRKMIHRADLLALWPHAIILTFEIPSMHIALVTRMLRKSSCKRDKLKPTRRVRAESSRGARLAIRRDRADLPARRATCRSLQSAAASFMGTLGERADDPSLRAGTIDEGVRFKRWQWREKERGAPWMSEVMGRMLGPHVASRSTFGGDMELSSIEPSRPCA